MKIQRYIFLFSIALVTSVACKAQLMADRDQSEDIPFKKTVLFSDFVSEGVAIGDVNRDGKLDVMAGPYWFEAPN